ncbi:glutamate-gated chloride channel-like protein, partial [Dinothrombium tinctorium]
SRPTNVNVSVLLLTISSPDESSLKYEVEFLLFQTWEDKRLCYAPERNPRYLNALHLREDLWMPDTYFILHGEFKEFRGPADPVHMALKIYPNGTVVYVTRRYMIITCEGHLNIFPFDSPKCFFAFESKSYEKKNLRFSWNPIENTRVTNTSAFRSLNAYLIKNKTGECLNRHSWRTEYSCLSVLLVFTRDKSFYFSTVFVPEIVLVTSSFIGFWLDVNAVPARIMIGVTTMLNFCTTTNSFRSSLPVVSNLTAMNLWDGVCMFFIYASMLELIIVNYLHRKIHHSSTRPQSSENQEKSHGLLAVIYINIRISPRTIIELFCRAKRLRRFRMQIERQCIQFYLQGRRLGESTSSDTMQAGKLNDFEVNASFSGAEDTTNSQLYQRKGHSQTASSLRGEDRIRAAASIFAWLRRPHKWDTQEITAHARLARSIDHVSKTVFPLLFGIFSVTFFIYYALYSPSKVDSNLDKEYMVEA